MVDEVVCLRCSRFDNTTGAGLHVARQLARRDEYAGMSIVCIFCDTGERYLSVPQLFEANVERMD